ncbi:MAG: hypothetical protein WD737_14740 [Gemmatimonadota bacterium]
MIALFVSAPALGATANDPPAVEREVVPTVAAEPLPGPAPAMNLTEIQIEERAGMAEAEVAQLPARGSFWWIVGAIVVGGVILSVLL